jgi:hypothetical protein
MGLSWIRGAIDVLPTNRISPARQERHEDAGRLFVNESSMPQLHNLYILWDCEKPWLRKN